MIYDGRKVREPKFRIGSSVMLKGISHDKLKITRREFRFYENTWVYKVRSIENGTTRHFNESSLTRWRRRS